MIEKLRFAPNRIGKRGSKIFDEKRERESWERSLFGANLPRADRFHGRDADVSGQLPTSITRILQGAKAKKKSRRPSPIQDVSKEGLAGSKRGVQTG